jgi:hypothetical protein
VEAASLSFDEVGHDLEALKRSLISLDAHEISTEQAQQFAQQISVIRLQLKRLLAEQRLPGDEH